MQEHLVPPQLCPSRSPPLTLRPPLAQQHQALLTLTLLLLLWQGQATNAGTMCFQCPICQDKDRFRMEMSTLGIQIPVRLVSFSPALQM